MNSWILFLLSPLVLLQLITGLLLALLLYVTVYGAHWRIRLLLLLSITCTFVGVVFIYKSMVDTKVTIDQVVNLYAGPGKNYPVITKLKEKSVVTIVHDDKSWYKIRHLNHKGWISAHSVE